MTTMDLGENVKAMLEPGTGASVGRVWRIPLARLAAPLGAGAAEALDCLVSGPGGEQPFSLGDGWLYLFDTRTAFLCLSLSFPRMESLAAVCNPGWAENPAEFFWLDGAGGKRPFDPDRWLAGLLAPAGLRKFFDGSSSFFLEAYAYIFALVPRWFRSLEEMRRITFRLHKMVSPDFPMEDEAEEDIRYVYAARNLERNAYRWGCCVTSQTIAYVTADGEMDLAAQREAQAADGLPVVLLALYEKYTCLRFTQLIAGARKEEIRALKDLMLNFQAFGTVAPANLSRWHNVKQIYANLLEVCDIPSAVQDISAKVSILTARQEAADRARSETVIDLITLFGIVSILASVLSIVQILADGDLLIWISTILTTAMLALVTALALLRK